MLLKGLQKKKKKLGSREPLMPRSEQIDYSSPASVWAPSLCFSSLTMTYKFQRSASEFAEDIHETYKGQKNSTELTTVLEVQALKGETCQMLHQHES